jgi:hypothetical protein
MIKNNKLSINGFEDKHYLTYSLVGIVSDPSFKLATLKDIEELFMQYFSENNFDIARVDVNFH